MWKTPFVVAVLTLAAWAAWLGWESGYVTDPSTESVSGPYAWWQVAGCVLTLIVLAAVAARWAHPLMVAAVMTVVFTAAWSAKAATSDESGLWLVGAILVAVGLAAGSVAVAFAGRWLART
ncbi:hypothetical protein [Actinoplanes sp. NPDC048796]|uniref:hypothetical protein n=1 Tax=unclassified Actinoplanes TaxID=2626549 RepID=UPI0033D4B5F4